MLGAFIGRRILQSVLVVFGVTAIVFGLMFLSGDPAQLMAGESATPDQVAVLRHQLGFDRPWYIQYGSFLGHAVRGDFGKSLRFNQPSFMLVMERMPATLELAFAAFLISLLISVPAGIIAAAMRNSIWDTLSMFGALVGQSIPNFWLGILLILFFGVEWKWLPVSGRGSGFTDGLRHLVLPAITLSMFSLARNTRMVRSSMLEVLGQDYIRTAYAKGLTWRSVIVLHALKNALIPVITLMGLQLGVLLGGAVIVETIFAWPGVGRLTIQAIYNHDFPLVQTAVVLLAFIFIALNLLVDILYTVIDPRISLR